MRQRNSILRDQRGAVAFETLLVYSLMVTALLLPLADVTAAGFQFMSAWAAMRSFGQYIQYNTPPDPTTSTGVSSWLSGLTTTTVNGYAMSNIKVWCGDGNAVCSDASLIPKYYTYQTTFTLTPIFALMRPVVCPSSCTYTLPYSERFE